LNQSATHNFTRRIAPETENVMSKGKGKAAKKSKPAKKATKKKPASSAEAPTSELWEQVKHARGSERKAERDVIEKTESLKSAKKVHDLASEHLGRLLDDAMNGQEQLPFGKPTACAKIELDAKGAGDVLKQAADDLWKSVKLEDLEPKIKPAKLKALSDVDPPIVTLGNLTDFQAERGEWWAKNVKGLGDGGVEQIVAATDAYWAKNPRKVEESPEKPSTAPGNEPGKASRGAGVKRAKDELADKVEARIVKLGFVFTIDDGGRVVNHLREGVGVDMATIDQVNAWSAKLDELSDDVIVNVVKSGAVAA
jgi:hypothetical protein